MAERHASARGAARRRREQQRVAPVAPRDWRLVPAIALPQRRVVAVDTGAWPQRRVGIGRLGRAVTGFMHRAGAGLELQDAEQQVTDVLAVSGGVAVPGREEVAGAERGLLLR